MKHFFLINKTDFGLKIKPLGKFESCPNELMEKNSYSIIDSKELMELFFNVKDQLMPVMAEVVEYLNKNKKID